MAYFNSTNFKKPTKPKVAKKPLKKVAKKGEFWLFVGKILNEFFVQIELPRRCEKCDGTRYGGPIQPAHTRRRQDIRVGDWWYALRVAVLCNDCHFEIDALGRRVAEPIIEDIIVKRFKRLGWSEQAVKQRFLIIAKCLQASDPKYQEFYVYFD